MVIDPTPPTRTTRPSGTPRPAPTRSGTSEAAKDLTFIMTVLRHTHKGQIDFQAITAEPCIRSEKASGVINRLNRILKKEGTTANHVFGTQKNCSRALSSRSSNTRRATNSEYSAGGSKERKKCDEGDPYGYEDDDEEEEEGREGGEEYYGGAVGFDVGATVKREEVVVKMEEAVVKMEKGVKVEEAEMGMWRGSWIKREGREDEEEYFR